MQLKIDNSRTYAIALEGGGAKGGYEIGVWKALDEAGIKYNAVSGTSVGALNGGMMAMRDLNGAMNAWLDMRLSKIMDLSAEQEENLSRAFSGSTDGRRRSSRSTIARVFSAGKPSSWRSRLPSWTGTMSM